MSNRQQSLTITRLDELFSAAREYRNSEAFKRHMDFCAHFHMVGAYNAMLLEIQREGVRYVLNEKRWRDYNRRPKPNARPLTILMPFYPLEFVFDVSDTEHIPGTPEIKYEEHLEAIAYPFKVKGELDLKKYDVFLSNLKYLGIKADLSMSAGSILGAHIASYSNEELMTTTIRRRECGLLFPQYFIISVNASETPEEQFVSICHELGHYFCRHMPPPSKKWWEERHVGTVQEEFEAEAVAWLVSERLGIKSDHSEEYLAGYMEKYGNVPDVAVGTIMSAVDRITHLFSPMTPSESLLYKFDGKFRKQVEEMNRQKK